MYAKGMTQSEIEVHTREIYGMKCSESTISRITDKILPVIQEWHARPLEAVYAVVFMDTIHFHVRSEGSVIKKALYIKNANKIFLWTIDIPKYHELFYKVCLVCTSKFQPIEGATNGLTYLS